jgi:hypothetical protein
MTPSDGPTGYVLPLSQMAETVRCVGVERRYVKFHAIVTVLPCAILKKDVCVWGGWVMVSPPAGADCGMLRVEVVADCEALPPGDADEEPPC